jgi:hypothetical protein
LTPSEPNGTHEADPMEPGPTEITCNWRRVLMAGAGRVDATGVYLAGLRPRRRGGRR